MNSQSNEVVKAKEVNEQELKEILGADKVEIVKNPNPPDENAILQQAAEIQREKNAKLSGRVQAFLSEKAVPPNEFVTYLVGKLRMILADSDMCQNVIRDLEQKLAVHRDRVLVLKGERQSCLQDIQEWDREIISGTEKIEENK